MNERKGVVGTGISEKDDDDDNRYVSVKERRRRIEERRKRRRNELRDKHHSDSDSSNSGDDNNNDESNAVIIQEAAPRSKTSLIDQAYLMKKQRDVAGITSAQNEELELEKKLLKEASSITKPTALISARERAMDSSSSTSKTEFIKTTWTPPRHFKLPSKSEEKERDDACRKKYHIIVQGDDIPPPIKSFKQMRLPSEVLSALKSKGILKPTPIQIQAIPAILSGRDVIGIAFTGSGKTITFTLPLIMMAAEDEKKMAYVGKEGPFGLLIGPSRELMRQTHEVVCHFTKALKSTISLRSVLCIGGEDKRLQVDLIKSRGVHIVVATPGRLNDLLKSRVLNLRLCQYVCLDEGDRMLDLGFDEEVTKTFDYFTHPRQTLIFSATMPTKFQVFAQQVLRKPVLVNVGRAGAASLDIIQEVEYVSPERRIVYILECLQKTPPPVLIFCEKKSDVDDIYEYLLLKGVKAASVHGGKGQRERNEAIDAFKENTKDVLVATDVAAKGLDFPNAIKHVINFDMPSEIENYVHRIGRTGRSGKTGVATTFINKNVDMSSLLDLKHLLIEAKQRVPPVLLALEDPRDNNAVKNNENDGCAFCGGLGHRITDCPKLDSQSRKIGAGRRDFLAGKSEGYGGDALG